MRGKKRLFNSFVEGKLEKKVLLIISQGYSTFTKNQIECIAPFFKHVFVLPVWRPIAELSNFFPIDSLKPFRKKVKIDISDLPGNITILPTPLNYLPLKSWYRRVGDSHLKNVLKILEKQRIQFDIIHCHFTYSSGYVGSKLKKQFHVPLVITAHGFDIYDLPFRDNFWQKRISQVLESADRIVTVSTKNIECIKRLGVRSSVELIPNGYSKTVFFPMKRSQARLALNLPLDKKIIVTVGNLVTVKGQKYLIDSVARLVRQHENLLCFIVGHGALRKELQDQIKQLGLGNYIQLTGEVAHEKICQWINACDLFVLPSLNEGNPTVLFECLGCGCPFIGSAVGGVPEIINDERLGLLFRPGDVDDMEKVINLGLATAWDRNYIINSSRSYTWDEIAKKIVKVYKQLLASG